MCLTLKYIHFKPDQFLDISKIRVDCNSYEARHIGMSMMENRFSGGGGSGTKTKPGDRDGRASVTNRWN